MNASETIKSYIGGQYTADAQRTLPNVCPFNGKPLNSVACATESQIEHAISSAADAFVKWSAMSGTERGRILARVAQLVRDNTQSLAELEVLETGKPIREAREVDIPSAADALEYFAGVAPTIHGDYYDLGTAYVYTRREPIGVCAGIGAWNYPLQIAAWKAAPALAAGNAMVFKPSEMTPSSALKLAEFFVQAGAPAGLFNVVQGDASIGQILAQHERIGKVSLTGSVPTGKKVMELASQNLKQVSLELGGKSPLIIYADSNLEQAVYGALMANFFTQGEICTNGTRVFVEDSVKDKFLTRLLSEVEKIKLGHPMKPDTTMGALISEAHLEKVLNYIKIGQQEGASLLCGGERPNWDSSDQEIAQGYFITPAVFSDCTDEMTIAKEEIFGPVMSVLSFKSEDEVITRANQTPFGLAAGVFTKDIQKANRTVNRLAAGVCWINNYNVTPLEVPFGGIKQSGMGRENGLAAIEHYTQIKTIYNEMTDIEPPF
ncbi:MAG: betaine-aldehyde dehydrogenase [Oligoflexus sp.]